MDDPRSFVSVSRTILPSHTSRRDILAGMSALAVVSMADCAEYVGNWMVGQMDDIHIASQEGTESTTVSITITSEHDEVVYDEDHTVSENDSHDIDDVWSTTGEYDVTVETADDLTYETELESPSADDGERLVITVESNELVGDFGTPEELRGTVFE